jgi:hypothetical protein
MVPVELPLLPSGNCQPQLALLLSSMLQRHVGWAVLCALG